MDVISLLYGIYINPPLIAGLEGFYNCSSHLYCYAPSFFMKEQVTKVIQISVI